MAEVWILDLCLTFNFAFFIFTWFWGSDFIILPNMSHLYNFVSQISSLIVRISPDFEMGPSARFERVAEGASHQTRIVRVTNDTLGLL